jgi:hypothetical protein
LGKATDDLFVPGRSDLSDLSDKASSGGMLLQLQPMVQNELRFIGDSSGYFQFFLLFFEKMA